MIIRLTVLRGLLLLIFAGTTVFLHGSGGSDEGASADRGEYIAESGQIIVPDEIRIHSYISSIDYGYPDPVESIDVTIQSGHQIISTGGQELLIQMGIQGRRGDFESIPPLNIAVLVDSSGSMSETDKIDYVRKAFESLLERLRPDDTLSVVVFAEEPKVIQSAAEMANIDADGLQDEIDRILPEGSAVLEPALFEAVGQVREGYTPESINRIILISDGMLDAGDSMDAAAAAFAEGISLSTIGVGAKYDLNFMVDLSKAGGGSSRFLKDPEKIREVFYTDFDRAFYAVANKLEMRLTFLQPVEVLGHWGYDGKEGFGYVDFSHPTVHFRDYETIIVKVETGPQSPGKRSLAVFNVEYTDASGRRMEKEPAVLSVNFADDAVPAVYPADRRVLLGGTILETAQVLKDIGTLYYSTEAEQARINLLNAASWNLTDTDDGNLVQEIIAGDMSELHSSREDKIRRCLDLTIATKHLVENVQTRLDTDVFEGELAILNAYTKTLRVELRMSEPVLMALISDTERGLSVRNSGLDQEIRLLAQELTSGRDSSTQDLHFLGFISGFEGNARLISRMDRAFSASMPGGTRRIPTKTLGDYLERSGIEKAELIDTDSLIAAGEDLGVSNIVAGFVMPLPESLIVFVRLIDIERRIVDRAAQSVIRKTPEILNLIDGADQ